MDQQQDQATLDEQGSRDGAPITGGIKDDLEGGTTGAASMTGGDSSAASPDQPGGSSAASAAGRDSPAGGDKGPIGMASAGGSPVGEAGGGAPTGPGGQGSLGSANYNERGNVTGPDSPAGSNAAIGLPREGQGEDLANRLGGGDNPRTGLTGAGSVSGDMSADRSEATGEAGAGAPDAGSPGGMGGVHAQGGTGTGRPPGGVSPLQDGQGDRE
jgi:hypothetical protein